VGATSDRGTYSLADDIMTSFSSKGPTAIDRIVKPDLLAPGNWVSTTRSEGATRNRSAPSKTLVQVLQDMPGEKIVCPSRTSQYNLPFNWCTYLWYMGTVPSGSDAAMQGTYVRMSGTSIAAPLVSGAAALLLAKNPILTPDAIKARLMKTARKNVFPASTTFTYTNPARTQIVRNDLFTVSAGYQDISAARNETSTAATTRFALSPTAGSSTAFHHLLNRYLGRLRPLGRRLYLPLLRPQRRRSVTRHRAPTDTQARRP
jgi:serine protease AprX